MKALKDYQAPAFAFSAFGKDVIVMSGDGPDKFVFDPY